MVRIDMSEYMEKHTVSRLIGSPPGFIGYVSKTFTFYAVVVSKQILNNLDCIHFKSHGIGGGWTAY